MRVNAVSPGPVDSREAGARTEVYEDAMRQRPLMLVQRVGVPADVVDATLMLLSNGFITALCCMSTAVGAGAERKKEPACSGLLLNVGCGRSAAPQLASHSKHGDERGLLAREVVVADPHRLGVGRVVRGERSCVSPEPVEPVLVRRAPGPRELEDSGGHLERGAHTCDLDREGFYEVSGRRRRCSRASLPRAEGTPWRTRWKRRTRPPGAGQAGPQWRRRTRAKSAGRACAHTRWPRRARRYRGRA